jgi:hypothetical protein
MPNVRQIDRAWEAIHALGELSQRALSEIERLDGQHTSASAVDLNQIQKIARESLVSFVSRALAGNSEVAPPAPSRTLSMLVPGYKESAQYRTLKYRSKRNYDGYIAKLEGEIGDAPLSAVDVHQVQAWHDRWSSGGKHAPVGRQRLTMFRIIIGFGAVAFADPDCIRLLTVMRIKRFPKPKGTKKRVNAAQVVALRKQAHAIGLPSFALALALQFDLKLGLLEVIGDWWPMSEPGDSLIVARKKKWLGGLTWDQLQERKILNIAGEQHPLDLKHVPMVLDELGRLSHIPKTGPMIVCERTELPYAENHFSSLWRKIANAANIPKSVFSTTHRSGAERAKRRARMQEGSHDLPAVVMKACQKLPDQIREDTAQSLMEGIVAGLIDVSRLPDYVTQYAREEYKVRDNRFTTVSLDQPLSDGSGAKLGDLVTTDREMWRR